MSVHISLDAGSCHMGNPEMAMELIDAASAAGASSIKFQLGVRPPNIPLALEHWPKLCAYAEKRKIEIFASCFTTETFNWYLRHHSGPKYIKFAFSQRKDWANMRQAIKKKFQVIASCDEMSDLPLTGIATVKLKCIPEYPLQYMPHFYEGCFQRFHGWSDHSLGIGVAIQAAKQGAYWIEKHLRLERSACPDACFALLPVEAKSLVISCVNPLRAA